MIDDTLNGFTGFAKRAQERAQGSAHCDAQDFSSDAQDAQRAQSREKLEFSVNQLNEIEPREQRWAWAQIDTSAIKHNIAYVKHITRPKRILACLSGDAYGHGAVQVAKAALNSGVNYLGVASVEEGVALRQAFVNAPILIMSQPPLSAVPLVLAYKLEPSITDAQFAINYAEIADAHGVLAPFHLRVNTGLNMGGISFDEAPEMLVQVNFHRALRLKGVYTEYALACDPNNIDFVAQVNRFEECLAQMQARGINPGIVHASGSEACLATPELNYDMVRLGRVIYGVSPLNDSALSENLQDAMSVHARITHVQAVGMGEGVGYVSGRASGNLGGARAGRGQSTRASGTSAFRSSGSFAGATYRSSAFRSAGSTIACTIPLGLADGLPSGASGANVLYRGVCVPIIGNVGMDRCAFECSTRANSREPKLEPHVGDEVVLVGRSPKTAGSGAQTGRYAQYGQDLPYGRGGRLGQNSQFGGGGLLGQGARVNQYSQGSQQFDARYNSKQQITSRITMQEFASQAGVSACELMCNLGNSRLPRIYV